jgi:hypothetical protein
VPPRQWRPVLHPAFTIAGTQPTVVIPQVRCSWASPMLAVHAVSHAPGYVW